LQMHPNEAARKVSNAIESNKKQTRANIVVEVRPGVTIPWSQWAGLERDRYCHGQVHPEELRSATRHPATNQPPLRRRPQPCRRSAAWPQPCSRSAAWLPLCCRSAAWPQPSCRSAAWPQLCYCGAFPAAAPLTQRCLPSTLLPPCRNCRDIIPPLPDSAATAPPQYRSRPTIAAPQHSAATPRTCGLLH
jgi:hypothetical protein